MQPSGADPYYPASGVPASPGYPPASGFPAAPTTPAYPPPGFPPHADAGAPGTYASPGYGLPLLPPPPGPPPPPPPRPRSLLIPLLVAGVLALVLAVVAFTAGYFTGKHNRETTSARPPQTATASSSAQPQPSAPSGAPDPSAATQQGVAGTWKGTYRCNQGETGLTLTIKGQDSALTATFAFYPTATNSDVPSGSYRMSGNVTDGTMRLIGTAWINRPDGYGMVNLTSTGIGATHLTGTVEFTGCSTFDLDRA
ncbi:hypothetical protein [Cryptosporangium sp. NPDC051539]|uniref:hypothetical protein n=1 Tax=Cryptosporangium sp. NPDC051539 TaxID=3363962 RepID=UPI00378A7816